MHARPISGRCVECLRAKWRRYSVSEKGKIRRRRAQAKYRRTPEGAAADFRHELRIVAQAHAVRWTNLPLWGGLS